MRLVSNDIEDRLDTKLDKSIVCKDSLGIMTFGKQNDYPYIIEKLINGSITAKASANIYAKFLTGEGFNEKINKIVIGYDERNKPVTVLGMLRKVAISMAYNGGAFIHCNENLERKIVNLSLIPFKYCRFTKIDDSGYTAKVAVYSNWDKKTRFEKEKIKEYNVFNLEETAFNAQIAELEGDVDNKVKSFKGQVYFCFLDNQYLYPLSPFDSCYLDCDTEDQISIYKNNSARNGMLKKTIITFVEPPTPEEQSQLKTKIKSFLGADGSSTLAVYGDVDENGNLNKSKNIAIDSIDSNIDSEAFGNWQKELANNIRKSMKALPAILIDYEESKLGAISGEAIIQATGFYNAITKDDRSTLSEMFQELLSQTNIPSLQNNTDWTIKPISLYEQPTNIQPTNSNQTNIIK